MRKERSLIQNLAHSIFAGSNYYLLGLFLFLFACDSAPVNKNTAKDPEKTKDTTAVDSNTKLTESGDVKAIEDYFLKLPDDLVGLTIEKRKELLEAHKKGKGSIAIDEYTKAELTKLDASNGYLSFSISEEGSGEGGGGSAVAKEFATFKNGENHILAFSSIEEGSGHGPTTSSINFFKVDADQLNKTKVNLPAFKLKDFYIVEKEGINCSNGEDKFNDFSCDLSKSNNNTIRLKANFNDAISCSANKGVELKFTGNSFE